MSLDYDLKKIKLNPLNGSNQMWNTNARVVILRSAQILFERLVKIVLIRTIPYIPD